MLTRFSGKCAAQIVLATNFDDVLYNQTSWINLISPARILMRDCARDKESDGVIVG